MAFDQQDAPIGAPSLRTPPIVHRTPQARSWPRLCIIRANAVMSLAVGAPFGPYEITAPIGVGGMGEVYRARDPRLNRDVAIKVLPDLFATDPERLSRFAREAQALAALNHSNIAHIHGIEEMPTSSCVRSTAAGRQWSC